jgi:hypothetical protein
MTIKRYAISILVLLFLCGGALAAPAESGKGLSVRTFQFKNKEADKAANVIKAMLSAEGSMSIQPATNALVVTDHADVLKSVAATLAEFDAPAHTVKLQVRIVGALRGEPSAAKVPSLSLLRFNQLESLGEAEVEGKEGEPGSLELQSGYRAEFRFGDYDPASDSIKLNDFRLSRTQKDQVVPLYKASLNLKVGQTIIVGASKPQGQRALMIVVMAKR